MLRAFTKEPRKDTLHLDRNPTGTLPNIRQKICCLKQFSFYCYMPRVGLVTRITMSLHDNIANVYEGAVCRDVVTNTRIWRITALLRRLVYSAICTGRAVLERCVCRTKRKWKNDNKVILEVYMVYDITWRQFNIPPTQVTTCSISLHVFFHTKYIVV
jgi:hypothetical protein